MGMYDSVMVPCPVCGTKNEFQSKSGACVLAVYELENCPEDVLYNINRHAGVCSECSAVYEVDTNLMKPVIKDVLNSGSPKFNIVEAYDTNEFDIKIPHKCPVCRGTGSVPNGFYDSTSGSWSTSAITPEVCRACGGSGIVWSK